ncbi:MULTISPECIES: hypothetical protein [Streptomyces]|uniref:Secreted protein n=1 Tax=Streptomyces clavifer TaxID=68188 RepID=A0ABS4V6I7_9ACTN|nr:MULTISPECIES: hypothetical protein [Streptomyces]MBP2359462.1 hypothetical protein [Streptomyces clavifer]MDX2744947.1 hypothetical protein [Streptomyces sp. NRRL_B-2557]MDX3061263.1 hypothetical protein [Streptomyces sp. ND04-05B]RPK80296.1 hypothetical protein EES45_13235 [Streptomyces sp. ADI97-07]WRY83840.1 hypothetical protein OG388_22705 [Streptomyces clavifer]
MRIGRPVVAGWALLVAGGWAATLWLGEPSATAGPRPAPASGSAPGDAAPGPQPEGGSCDTSPSSVTGTAPPLPAGTPDTRAVQHVCYFAVVR